MKTQRNKAISDRVRHDRTLSRQNHLNASDRRKRTNTDNFLSDLYYAIHDINFDLKTHAFINTENVNIEQ